MMNLKNLASAVVLSTFLTQAMAPVAMAEEWNRYQENALKDEVRGTDFFVVDYETKIDQLGETEQKNLRAEMAKGPQLESEKALEVLSSFDRMMEFFNRWGFGLETRIDYWFEPKDGLWKQNLTKEVATTPVFNMGPHTDHTNSSFGALFSFYLTSNDWLSVGGRISSTHHMKSLVTWGDWTYFHVCKIDFSKCPTPTDPKQWSMWDSDDHLQAFDVTYTHRTKFLSRKLLIGGKLGVSRYFHTQDISDVRVTSPGQHTLDNATGSTVYEHFKCFAHWRPTASIILGYSPLDNDRVIVRVMYTVAPQKNDVCPAAFNGNEASLSVEWRLFTPADYIHGITKEQMREYLEHRRHDGQLP